MKTTSLQMRAERALQTLERFASITLVIAAISAAHGLAAESAAEGNAHLWKPRVTSVAVFKNGLGFFLRGGDVALRDGWCLAGEVPPAHFGTLAIYSHGKDEAVDIVGAGPGETVAFDGIDAPKDPAVKRARLQACQRLKVQLTYTQKEADRTAAGKLVSVGPDFAVLESETSTFAVPIAGIQRLQVLDLPLRVHVAGLGAQAPARTTLGMAYLRKGITWIPEYTLKLLDDTTAELTLRGTLVNEAEDLVHCDVNFVVGVPNFLHADFLAPLAVGQVIRTIGAAVAPREVMSQIANRAAIANDQRSAPFAVTDRPAAGAVRDVRDVLGNLPQLEGPGAADFTVYTRKDLTVRRGEKAIVTLFTKRITYGHVFRWSPPEALRHYLVLKNNTDTAWTTGPCLALNHGSPLTEDLLLYVPKGGSGEIPVTTAINVANDQKETETDRKLKVHEPAHQFYVDLITLEGELKIRNFEPSEIRLMIRAKVPGKPLAASDNGTLMSDPTKLQLLDRSGTIEWRLQVPSGATRTVTYTYERYVPSK
ncbi:MAG: hypothetical protein JXQ71_02220 [Verrucomicrobia bacterium]|nr:hypothetical protein [Verrucomicrobiota bacterium]